MDVGSEFSTWNGFSQTLEKFSKDNQVSYTVGVCSPVENANRHDCVTLKFPSKFKYCYARMVCSHGINQKQQGKYRARDDDSRRTHFSCSSSVLVCVNKRRTALVIMEANFNHTHHSSNNLITPSRRLKGNERRIASVLLRGGVPLHRVQEFISFHETQGDGPLIDLYSSHQKSLIGTDKNENQFLFCLDQLMTEDPNCIIEIIDFNLMPSLIYIQTSEMSKRIEQMVNFDIQSLQFITYKPTGGNLAIFSAVGVDGELDSHILALCIASLEKDSYFSKFVETFVSVGHDQSFCDRFRGIVLDCTREEADLVQMFFPPANIAWSRSYTLERFEKEAKKLSKAEPNYSLSIFKEMMNSSTEFEYKEKLKCFVAASTSKTAKEFLKCWDSCKEMWVQYEIAEFDALKHQKSAIEMDYLNKLCRFVKQSLTLSDILMSLLRLDKNEEINEFGVGKTEEIRLNPSNKLYRSLCLSESAEAVMCQIAIAESSSYDIKKQGNVIVVKRIDFEKEFELDVAGGTCSCQFYNSHELPCQHIFAWRKFTGKEFYDESLVPLKWQVLGESITLDSLAESLAQGSVPSSALHEERFKALQNVLKDMLTLCGSHSYEDMGKDIVLLKQVLGLMKQGQSGNLNKEFNHLKNVDIELSPNLSSHISASPLPKKRGRKSKKEKEILASQQVKPLSNENQSPSPQRRHNLRTNIKHKFVTRDLTNKAETQISIDNNTLKSTSLFQNSDSAGATLGVMELNSEQKGVEVEENELQVSWGKDADNEMIGLPKVSLMETLSTLDKDEEFDKSPNAKRLKRNKSAKRFDDHKYKIMKCSSENEFSDNESDDSNDDGREFVQGDNLVRDDFTKRDDDVEWESLDAKQARLEQDLSKFLNGMSVESIQELMQGLSMLEHFEGRSPNGHKDNKEWSHPVDFLLHSCCQDKENLDFIIRNLEKQISDHDKFVCKVAACLILTAFNTETEVSKICESISEWPSHLPQLPFSISPEDIAPLDADQVLTVCGHRLHKSDIATLNSKSGLSSQVIHAYLEVLAQRHNGKMFVIPFDVVQHWRNETFGEMLFKKVHFKTFDYLVLPIHCGAELLNSEEASEDGEVIKPQWMVLIANIRNKTVGMLNPRGEDIYTIAANGYMIQWRRYMQIRSILTGEMLSAWTNEGLHCSKQTMDHTSGALVLMNVEAIVSNVSPSVMTEAHINRYMHYVGVTLRDTDRETTVLCVGGLECQQMAAQDTDWLQCENCRAWWHRACSGHDAVDRDKTFYCSPCKQRIANVKSSGKRSLDDGEKLESNEGDDLIGGDEEDKVQRIEEGMVEDKGGQVNGAVQEGIVL